METIKITTRSNNKIEIIPFLFDKVIMGYIIKVNNKYYKRDNSIKTFRTLSEAKKEIPFAEIFLPK